MKARIHCTDSDCGYSYAEELPVFLEDARCPKCGGWCELAVVGFE